MMYHTALKVLKLPDGYTQSMLKDAYRRAAQKAHPDRGGSQAKFVEVTQAYTVLYDRLPCPTCNGQKALRVKRGIGVVLEPCPNCSAVEPGDVRVHW